MIGLQLFPVVLSLLVLGAHFLRAGAIGMVGVVAILLGLPGVRRRWAVRTIQAALLLGAVEWLRTLVELVAVRAGAGQPVLRLFLILGGVALLTALSTLMFRTSRLQSRYGLGRPRVSGGA